MYNLTHDQESVRTDNTTNVVRSLFAEAIVLPILHDSNKKVHDGKVCLSHWIIYQSVPSVTDSPVVGALASYS